MVHENIFITGQLILKSVMENEAPTYNCEPSQSSCTCIQNGSNANGFIDTFSEPSESWFIDLSNKNTGELNFSEILKKKGNDFTFQSIVLFLP